MEFLYLCAFRERHYLHFVLWPSHPACRWELVFLLFLPSALEGRTTSESKFKGKEDQK